MALAIEDGFQVLSMARTASKEKKVEGTRRRG